MIPTLRAELTKIVTMRSVQVTLAIAILIPSALALASGLAFDAGSSEAALFPIESHGFETAGLDQPLIILFAALVAGGEYVDGQLRSSLLAMPQRGRLLLAKLMLISAASALVGLVATGAAVLVKHATLGAHGLAVDEFTRAMGGNLLGVTINYALISILAAGLTILTRTFVITLVVLIPLVLGMTISLLGILPAVKYLPDLAGLQLLTAYPGVGLLDPIHGGLVMAAWSAAFAAAAWSAFRRRDAS
jgi:ABC-2 type transport system permease protein